MLETVCGEAVGNRGNISFTVADEWYHMVNINATIAPVHKPFLSAGHNCEKFERTTWVTTDDAKPAEVKPSWHGGHLNQAGRINHHGVTYPRVDFDLNEYWHQSTQKFQFWRC